MDDLAQLLETTARAIAGVLRRPAQRPPTLSALSALSARRTLDALVGDAERALVALARPESHTWQEIADALGATRQAAHQRFSPSPEAWPESWPPGTLEEAGRVVHAVATGRFDEAGAHFDERLRRAATPDWLEEVWRKAVALLGPFLEAGTPAQHVTRWLFVVDTPPSFERGQLLARTVSASTAASLPSSSSGRRSWRRAATPRPPERATVAGRSGTPADHGPERRSSVARSYGPPPRATGAAPRRRA